MEKFIRNGPGLALVLFLSALTARASITGSISGVVKDPTGAVIPNGEVALINVETDIRQTARTDTLGVYSFLAVPVGRYRLEVKAPGFKTYQQTGIALNANDVLVFDVSMQLGEVTQAVEVSTTAVHVETATTQMGDVIGSNTMETLPLNGRNFTDLLGLQPGVVPVSAGTIPGGASYAGNSTTGNVSISGQRESANGFQVNGGNVEEARNNGTSIIPNLDSIAEFRLITNNPDAEYGQYSGGLVNVVTKSGTNEWHGSAFEFLRNEKLDARNFFSIEREVLKRNQIGGTLGGRVIRDKVFFFADYQGTRETRTIPTGEILVPSVAERGGDFSAVAANALTGSVGGPYFASLLSQRLGYTVTSGEPYYYPANPTAGTPACTSATGANPCVFPNGIIPQTAYSPTASGLLQFISPPNQGDFFVSSANKYRLRDDRGSARVDGNSRWGMLTAYYFADDSSRLKAFGADSFPGFPTSDFGRSQQINLSDTKSFGGTAVNEFRFNFTRFVDHGDFPASGTGVKLSSLGFQEGGPGGFIPDDPKFEGVPAIGFNNFSIGLPGIVFNRFESSPQFLDNFSWVKGKHTLKFGGAYHFTRFNMVFPLVGGNGFVGFSGSETGTDFADFLIGAPDFFIQESHLNLDERKNYVGLYGQDSWRARSDLTVNYGLRWDLIQPWSEKSNQKATYALGVQSTVFPQAPQGQVFVGDVLPGYGKISRTISRTPHNDFAPRIGIAYTPSASGGVLARLLGGPGKTSLRASYGLFYTNMEGIQAYNSDPPIPFVVFTVIPTPLFEAPYRIRADGSMRPNPFPFTRPNLGDPNADFTPLLPIAGFATIQVRNKTTYAEHYHLTLQRQIGANTLVTLGYVGSQGHHLLGTLPINPGNPQLCLALSDPAAVAPGTATCGPFGEDLTYTRANGTLVVGTRGPFGLPNFSDNTFALTGANSSYNALEASLRHTAGRLYFLAGYTYGKSLDNSSAFNDEPMNPFNQSLTRSLSAFDVTHNFVLSYNYLLPLDRLGGNRHPRLTAGWRLVGITRFTTGLPITLQESDDGSLLGTFGTGIGAGIDEPDYLGGPLKFTDPRTGKPYFDTSQFTPEYGPNGAPLGRLGTAGRRIFHGPGLNNFDFAVLKELKATEKVSLQFRGEFFNMANHAQFLNSSGNINGDFGFVRNAREPRIGQVAIKVLF